MHTDGAALFYVSSHRPESVSTLRKYLLHRLFDRSSVASSNSSTNRFRLDQRASTVDRDTVFVPSGWDSYGKIKALRGTEDSFDCAAVRSSWELDFRVELERRLRIVRDGVAENDASLKEQAIRASLLGPEALHASSAVELFEDVVGDWHRRDAPVAPGSKIASPDMQAFLAQHFSTLQKDPDPKTAAGGADSAQDARRASRTEESGRRGVMGPMAANGLNLLPKMEIDEPAQDEVNTPVRSSKPRIVSRRVSTS